MSFQLNFKFFVRFPNEIVSFQNKDAFFNANPNFKWYKLPAPPLRTLATRPSNAATGGVGPSGDDNQPPPPHPTQLQLQKIPLDLLRSNYFKLADETQMGELSSLLQVQVQEKDYALQQVLSETSQFLSAHMPGATGNQPASASTGLKRSFDSQSSNSSEEEGAIGSPNKKAKSSRSCKGKIYQELVNSASWRPSTKRARTGIRQCRETLRIHHWTQHRIRHPYRRQNGRRAAAISAACPSRVAAASSIWRRGSRSCRLSA